MVKKIELQGGVENMEVKEVRKRGYDIEKFTITPENIGNFVLMPNRRQISESHVSKIHGVLLQKKNPIGILIVNRKDNIMRIIDGNHRFEAVKRFYSYKNALKKARIECILKVYSDLTEDQEREIYTLEAKRKNESHEDRLQLYKDKIIFWDLVKSRGDFPCKVTIYKSKTSLRFRTLINAIYSLKQNQDKGYNLQYLSKEDLVPFAIGIMYNDYVSIKEFLDFFKEVFGEVNWSNPYTRDNVFIALLDVYVRNLEYKDMKSFKERFRSILNKNDIITYMRMGGRESSIEIRKAMIRHMNHNIKLKVFI